jgi:hypothetical protein
MNRSFGVWKQYEDVALRCDGEDVWKMYADVDLYTREAENSHVSECVTLRKRPRATHTVSQRKKL